MKIISNSVKETLAVAKKIAAKAKGGEIYALTGDLGAGKTVFTRGFCAGLGVKKNVNSPTFVLMKVYPVKRHKNIKEVWHIDAYRLKSEKELEAVGALEYFNRKDVVCLVEWPERIKKILGKNTRTIKIKTLGENKRSLEIK
jgi:tRNA threonylcarbamoyladenosine biosynthesis protein TsaE